MSQQQTSTIGSIIIDRSAKNLNSALAAVQKALTDLNALTEQSGVLALQIEDKQLELQAIAEQVATARHQRPALIPLELH